MKSGKSRYGHGDILAVPAIKKDGSHICIEFTITPMRDETGQLVGLIAILRDVTKRFEEIRALKRKLGQPERNRTDAAARLAKGRDGWRIRFFTIGHSSRSIREFTDLLMPEEIKLSLMSGPFHSHVPILTTTRITPRVKYSGLVLRELRHVKPT